MDIEKVKNYNQKLLAAFGTLALAALVGVVLIGLVVFIIGIIPGRRDTSGLLSDEAVPPQQSDRRQQIVSYGFPELVDSANLRYVIPAGFYTLDQPRSSFSKLSKEYPGSLYMNLLIYDANAGTVSPLFHNRVLVGYFTRACVQEDVFITFRFIPEDSNRDGTLNMDDYHHLGLYSFGEQKLYRVGLDKGSVIDFGFIEGTKDLLLTIGVDEDENGTFSSSSERIVVKRFGYKKNELTDVVPQQIQESLQKIIERNQPVN